MLTMAKIRIGNPRFLYYHTVRDRHLPHLRYIRHFKSLDELEKDLDYLAKGHQFIALTQLQESLQNGQPLPKHSLVLSFDDGFSEIYTHIAPLLSRKGIPAVFFLTTDFIDNKVMFYRCLQSTRPGARTFRSSSAQRTPRT
jgi:peptidoglycan/xylan/chitin deacetylase (PgdA/CDA1 family)